MAGQLEGGRPPVTYPTGSPWGRAGAVWMAVVLAILFVLLAAVPLVAMA